MLMHLKQVRLTWWGSPKLVPRSHCCCGLPAPGKPGPPRSNQGGETKRWICGHPLYYAAVHGSTEWKRLCTEWKSLLVWGSSMQCWLCPGVEASKQVCLILIRLHSLLAYLAFWLADPVIYSNKYKESEKLWNLAFASYLPGCLPAHLPEATCSTLGLFLPRAHRYYASFSHPRLGSQALINERLNPLSQDRLFSRKEGRKDND